MRPLAVASVCLAVSLGASGCRDTGQRHLLEAQRRYQLLVDEGRPVGHPSFDEVLAELARVPESSSGSVQARELERRIVGARQLRLERPLARESDESVELRRKTAECVELAQRLGQKVEEREVLRVQVERCRAEVNRLEEALHLGRR